MYNEWAALLSAFFVAVSVGIGLLVLCGGKKKPSGKHQPPAPSINAKTLETKVPATKAPVTSAPATKTPATNAPTTKAPATKSPAIKPPAPAGDVATFNYGVCIPDEPDLKDHTKTISEDEPEDVKPRLIKISSSRSLKLKSPHKEHISAKDQSVGTRSKEKAIIEEKQERYVNFAISEAQADFAVKLLRHVSQDRKDASVIMSPVSIAVTLAMVYAGAKKETKTQLETLIAKGASDEEIHKHFGSLFEELSAKHAGYKLEAANRVYAREDFAVHDAFKADIGRYYRGFFQQVDFKDGAKAAKEINDFVEEKTHQKIKNVISPGDLDKYTRLVLVNAIYFKGTWQNKFSKARTVKKTFYVSEGNEAKVDMMHLTRGFIYFDDDNAQVLGMPYKGDDLFMFVILPRERYGLLNVLGSLDGKKLAEYLGKRDWCKVIVQLPRFKVETSLALKDALTDLGLIDAFDDRKANFQGIAKEDTNIDAVLHKAFVETNEEGTEAAAATFTITGVSKCWKPPSPPPREFIADHPFLYVITNRSAAVLFFGYLLKP